MLAASVIFTLQDLVHGQSVSRAGGSAGQFLKIGVGARNLAMGEAVTTRVSDITAMYWNPAGLGLMQKNQLIFNHFDYIADLNFEYGGFAVRVGSAGTFGMNFTYLGAPDLERTTIDLPEGTGEQVSCSFYSIGFSFGRAITDRVSAGATVKYIRESLWHESASAVALDLGILYRGLFNALTIGMSIRNFGSEMKLSGRDLLVQHDIEPRSGGNNENINADLSTDAFPLPISFRFGVSTNLARDIFNVPNQDLVVSVDAVHPNDDREYLNIGGEYTWHDFLALRAGYRQLLLEDAEGGLTFGFGVQHRFSSVGLAVDYARLDYGRLDFVNKFSFILSF
ncbi:MAG: PorV/PorQ family protein [Candidatus Zixiibacteriota bacterium]